MINWLRTQYGRFSDWQRKRKADAIRKDFLERHEREHGRLHKKFPVGMWIECEDCDGFGYLPGDHICIYCHGGGRVFRGL